MDFGRILKIKDDSGNVKRFQGYVTKTVTLEAGTTFYLNDLEESLDKKVEYKFISEQEKTERLGKIREMDEKYNRETKYVCRAVPKKNEGAEEL